MTTQARSYLGVAPLLGFLLLILPWLSLLWHPVFVLWLLLVFLLLFLMPAVDRMRDARKR